MSNDYQNLTAYEFFRHCVHTETIGLHSKFSWGRAIRRVMTDSRKRFLFGWRLASYLHATGGKRRASYAHKLNHRLARKHNVEIELGAVIGPGIQIAHHNGIVLSRLCRIGANFNVYQNVTIGAKHDKTGLIRIGDNVTIGAHSCLIGLNMTIGDNVTIGAGTFLDKNLDPGVVCYSKREYTITKPRQKVTPLVA